jgi:hypothetical protein
LTFLSYPILQLSYPISILILCCPVLSCLSSDILSVIAYLPTHPPIQQFCRCEMADDGSTSNLFICLVPIQIVHCTNAHSTVKTVHIPQFCLALGYCSSPSQAAATEVGGKKRQRKRKRKRQREKEVEDEEEEGEEKTLFRKYGRRKTP